MFAWVVGTGGLVGPGGLVGIGGWAGTGGLARATPFVVPVDESASVVSVELCLLGTCDADTSGVAGSWTIALDDPEAPSAITLHDFDLAFVDTIDLSITITVFGVPVGGLDVTGTGLSMRYATPGTPSGPVAIVDGVFAFSGVSVDVDGVIEYDATGTVCALFKSSGVPCSATLDLGAAGPQPADLAGAIEVESGVATITVDPTVEVPLNPDTPEVGTLSVSGTVTGHGDVPLKGDGDWDGDGDVDMRDFGGLQVCFGGGPLDDACARLDFDADGSIDAVDFAGLFEALTGP
ncbi:MAG: dockerin type I domain-containing protein [Phycisphaerae bacterium]